MRDPARILAVDDDPASLALMRVLLEAQGYAVLTAVDASSALEIVKNHRIDLALIDLVLPDRSGIELARLIRQSAEGDSIALVAVSAHLGALDDARLSPVGFSDSIAKPFDPEVVIRSVGALVQRPRESASEIGGGRRVLLVDDDPVLRRLEAMRMERLGFVVETATSGADALDICRQRPPDAVVSDVLMPGMDGFSLCLALRALPSTAGIPVVLISAHYVEEEDRKLGEEVGATVYVARDPHGSTVAAALLRAFELPPPAQNHGTGISGKMLADQHAARLSRQLERQTQLNAVLRERTTYQQALLASAAAISESLAVNHESARIFEAGLQPILSARAFSAACAFSADYKGRLSCVAKLGLVPDDVENLWGRPELLELAIRDRETIVVPSSSEGGERDRGWLDSLGFGSLLIVPVSDFEKANYGVLVLIVRHAEVSSELLAFTRTLRHSLAAAIATASNDTRLRKAEKMDAIGRLAAGIAHDFNNLLAAISCYASFTERSIPSDSPLREGLVEINNVVDRGAELTSQLLTFGKRPGVVGKSSRPDAVVRSVLPMVRRLIGENIEITDELCADEAELKVEAGRVEQVLVNLCINARDAMPDGGLVRIASRLETLDLPSALLGPGQKSGLYYVLDIADEGYGMSEEERERAFEPFFTTKSEDKGTGLGLATIYGIVRDARGNITLASRAGVGTRVTIVLPVVRKRAPSPSLGLQLPRAASPGMANLLLAEDESALRSILVRMLEAEGYQVASASRGDEALALAQDGSLQFDLLITDIVMPGLQGPELAKVLLEDRPNLPILFISGYSDGDFNAKELPPTQRFLAKPFAIDALLQTVEELLVAAEKRLTPPG